MELETCCNNQGVEFVTPSPGESSGCTKKRRGKLTQLCHPDKTEEQGNVERTKSKERQKNVEQLGQKNNATWREQKINTAQKIFGRTTRTEKRRNIERTKDKDSTKKRRTTRTMPEEQRNVAKNGTRYTSQREQK